MNHTDEMQRMTAKTPEQQLLYRLTQAYGYPPAIARALVQESQGCLLGPMEAPRVGQQRVILVSAQARHGNALDHTATLTATWTVDNGAEDQQVLAEHGAAALRRVRIQRLLDEAYEQGALATQEDLARVLHCSLRTIKRDCAQLEQQGSWLPTRGRVQGIGRGQTHKAQIVARWLQGETYAQLTRSTHHAPSSIQRYLQRFVQVVRLQRAGYDLPAISQLAQLSQPLVADYLAVYAANDQPSARARLAEQLERLGRGEAGEKGAK